MFRILKMVTASAHMSPSMTSLFLEVQIHQRKNRAKKQPTEASRQIENPLSHILVIKIGGAREIHQKPNRMCP